MRRILMAVGLVLGACHELPARNDPATAKGFYCSMSEVLPETGICIVDNKQSCDSTVTAEAKAGKLMSPCLASKIAWCVVSTFGNPPWRVFDCASTRDACIAKREEVMGDREHTNVGECIERTAGR